MCLSYTRPAAGRAVGDMARPWLLADMSGQMYGNRVLEALGSL